MDMFQVQWQYIYYIILNDYLISKELHVVITKVHAKGTDIEQLYTKQ